MRWSLAALATSVVLVAAPPAFGQQRPDPAAVAREAFARGIAALEQNRFDDAVPALEESYRLRPLPVVAYNLGLAYRGLSRTTAAIEAFERFLAADTTDVSAEERQVVRDEVARLRATVGAVTLAGAPQGSLVRVDGRTRAGAADATILLDPGTHVVEVAYPPSQHELTVRAGEQRALDVRLPTPAPRTHAGAWVLPRTGRDAEGAGAAAVSPLVWIGAGVALVAAGSAIGLGVAGNTSFESYQRACVGVASPPAACQAQYDDLRTVRPAVVDALWVGAGLGVAATVIGLLLPAPRASRLAPVRARALLGPTLAGAVVSF